MKIRPVDYESHVVLASAPRSLGSKLVTQLTLDLYVAQLTLDLPVSQLMLDLIFSIIYCTDTGMFNVRNFKKVDFKLNPSVSLLKYLINCLITGEKLLLALSVEKIILKRFGWIVFEKKT